MRSGLETFSKIAEDTSDPQVLADALFNASNGEGALAQLMLKRGEREPAFQAFRNQRALLQRVLLTPGFAQMQIRDKALANYANTLEELGRTSEAIDYYYRCLEFRPDHAVAMGNCGRALFNLLNVDSRHNTRLLIESLHLHQQAVSNADALVELSGPNAIELYNQSLSRVQDFVNKHIEGGIAALERNRKASLEAHPEYTPDEFEESCIADRLLLTVNPLAYTCPTLLKDDLFIEGFSTKGGPAGIERAEFIIDTFNQIKEDFASARFLYYAAHQRDDVTIRASSATYFGSSPSSADFNLRCGLLKASFRIAADSLDKIAWFLNGYLNLGVAKKNVFFSILWYENGEVKKGLKSVLQTEIESCRHMKGLYEISQTFREFPGPLKELRNDATHSVLHLFGPANEPHLDPAFEGKVATLNFRSLTLELLRMLKGAVICLTGYVAFAEAKNKRPRHDIEFRYGVSRSDQEDAL